MTTIHPLPASPLVQPRRAPVAPALCCLSVVVGVGAWLLLSGPQRGAALGGCLLLAGAVLLGRKLREYAGLALFVTGGLLAGMSLLWLLVVAPVVEGVERQVHDLTHPTVGLPTAPDVVGGVTGLIERAKGASR